VTDFKAKAETSTTTYCGFVLTRGSLAVAVTNQMTHGGLWDHEVSIRSRPQGPPVPRTAKPSRNLRKFGFAQSRKAPFVTLARSTCCRRTIRESGSLRLRTASGREGGLDRRVLRPAEWCAAHAGRVPRSSNASKRVGAAWGP